MARSDENLRLDFGSLPLIETAVRISLASPLTLTFESINRVHNLFRSEFPQITEPQQIEIPPGIKEGTISLGQIPGAVFTGNERGLTIHLQAQLVAVRWTKPTSSEGPEYPRYAVLRDTLWRALSELLAACDPVPVVVVNMLYANFIRPTTASHNIVEKYLSPIAHLPATKGSKQIYKVEGSWQQPDMIDLRFSIDQISLRTAVENLEGFRLLTSAGLRISEGDDRVSALDRIHDRLQSFFRDLISSQAKVEWQMNEAADE